MKKLVSLFVCVLFVVSMLCCTCVVASAEGEVVCNDAVFLNLDDIKSLPHLAANDSKFMLNFGWIVENEGATVRQVFQNINYTLEDPTNLESFTVASGSAKIWVEYCSPSKDYKDSWTPVSVGTAATNGISIGTNGWWAFRFVAKTAEGERLAETPGIYIYFGDAKAPSVTALSPEMNKSKENGITAGSTYSIKTNVVYSDDSSTTVTYVVYKKVGGSWKQIYDSKTGTVVEGYEDVISGSTINVSSADVLPNKEPVYRIVYTATDSLGYVTETFANSEEPIVLELFAVEEEKVPVSATKVWTIVLYCIAALATVGIIVVLFIKPKQPAEDYEVPAPKDND